MYLLKMNVHYQEAAPVRQRVGEDPEAAEAYRQVAALVGNVLGEDAKYVYFDLVGTIEDLELVSKLFNEVRVSNVRGLFKGPAPVTAGDLNAAKPAVQIHVPGSSSLADMVVVQVLEDYCTDALQEWLSVGWRMVAVCPPYDSRRPTYVVGHNDRNAVKPY